jgi:hypothetical protein
MSTAINGIKKKQADTTQEQILLGYIEQECERIGYGSISIEVSVRSGKIDRLTATLTKQTINLGLRDQ